MKVIHLGGNRYEFRAGKGCSAVGEFDEAGEGKVVAPAPAADYEPSMANVSNVEWILRFIDRPRFVHVLGQARKTAPRPVTFGRAEPPKPDGRLVWVMLSDWGSQIMLVANEDNEFVWGFKWRDQGRKWTKRVRAAKALVKGPVTEKEMETAKVRRALDAMKEQLGVVRT